MMKMLLVLILYTVALRAVPVLQTPSHADIIQETGSPHHDMESRVSTAIAQPNVYLGEDEVSSLQMDLIDRVNLLEYNKQFSLEERAIMNQQIREDLTQQLAEVKSRLSPVDVFEWSPSNVDLSRAIDQQFLVLVSIAQWLDDIDWDDIRAVFPPLMKNVRTDVFPQQNAVIDEGLSKAPNFEYLEQALAQMLQIIRAIENSIALMEIEDVSIKRQLESLKQFYETVVRSFTLEEETYLSIYASQTLFMGEYNMHIVNQIEDILEKIEDYGKLKFEYPAPSDGDALSSYAEHLVELKSKLLPRPQLEKGQASQNNILLVRKQFDAVKNVLQEVDDVLEQIQPQQDASRMQLSIKPTAYTQSDALNAEMEQMAPPLESQQQLLSEDSEHSQSDAFDEEAEQTASPLKAELSSVENSDYRTSDALDEEIAQRASSLQSQQPLLTEDVEYPQSHAYDAEIEQVSEEIANLDLQDDFYINTNDVIHAESPTFPPLSMTPEKPIQVANRFDTLVDSDPNDVEIEDSTIAQLTEQQLFSDQLEPAGEITDISKSDAQTISSKTYPKKKKKDKKKATVNPQLNGQKEIERLTTEKSVDEIVSSQLREAKQVKELMSQIEEVASMAKKGEHNLNSIDWRDIQNLQTLLYRNHMKSDIKDVQQLLSQKLFNLVQELKFISHAHTSGMKIVASIEDQILKQNLKNAQLSTSVFTTQRSLNKMIQAASVVSGKIRNQYATASDVIFGHNAFLLVALKYLRDDIKKLLSKRSEEELAGNAEILNSLIQRYQTYVSWLVPDYNYNLSESKKSQHGAHLETLEKDIKELTKYGETVQRVFNTLIKGLKEK
ncbi:hypothetical protein MP228_001836 [Amoeboaphelidium protococcarum]|nr:hypothetical protein MP228_001836 [Amoeboaphelidium protococcarum]